MYKKVEINKKNAVEFYRMAYMGEPKEAVRKYVGEHYIQHNPDVEDGKEGFIEYFERMAREYPNKSIKFLRVIGEGELVSLHTLQTWPDNIKYITMDFFLFNEDGKIIEHWDSIQEVPEKTKSGNPMY